MPQSSPTRSLRKHERRALLHLRERDGDICWVCGLPMDFTPHDGGTSITASVDHITPLREGGSNLMDNLKLAHRLCNQVRDFGGKVNLRKLRHSLHQAGLL